MTNKKRDAEASLFLFEISRRGEEFSVIHIGGARRGNMSSRQSAFQFSRFGADPWIDCGCPGRSKISCGRNSFRFRIISSAPFITIRPTGFIAVWLSLISYHTAVVIPGRFSFISTVCKTVGSVLSCIIIIRIRHDLHPRVFFSVFDHRGRLIIFCR